MAAEIDRLHEEQASSGFRANMLLGRGRLFEEAVQHPFVFALAENLTGRGCLMYQSNCIRKAPGFDPHQLHCDHIAMSEPFPDWPIGITSMWALEDWDSEVGPTLFVPGSFRERRHPRPGETRPTEPLLMPKGSIAVWNGATWHSSSPRKREGLRRSLHNVYTRMQFRPMDDYRAIDPAIVQRNAPRFSTICGLDDFFGRNTNTGPELEVMKDVFEAGYGAPPLPRS